MELDQNDVTLNFQKNLKLNENEPKPRWTELSEEPIKYSENFNINNLVHEQYLPENEQITDANKNRIHHAEYDFTEFESTEDLPELSAKCLIIKEVIEDLLLRTFNIENEPNTNSDNELDSESEIDIPRVRRCSSLKTGKTPPGTPSLKKIVRFADVLGLDLADVRTYLDDIPRVPSSAYKDLINCDPESNPPKIPTKLLLALFQQPVSLPNFLAKLTMSMVIVENAYVDDPVSFCIKGTIRVRNLSFHKSVHVRHTMDMWKRSSDVAATYVEGSSDGFTDQFQFMLYAYGLEIGSKLEFAARYCVNGQEYWDNNNGSNYCFQCLLTELPQPAPMTPGINEQFVTFYYNDQNPEMPSDTNLEDPLKEETPCDSGRFAGRAPLNSAQVQEIIARSLGKHKMAGVAHTQGNPKPEVLLFCVVLFVSIVILYARRLLF